MHSDMDDKDALLQLKKRARRRLVGAVFLAGSAAIVLNMAMDHQPRQETRDVDIRIPGQDEKPFAPRFAAAPPPAAPLPSPEAPTATVPTANTPPSVVPNIAPPALKAPAVNAVPAVAVQKQVDLPQKPVEKLPVKPPAEKAEVKNAPAETQRAAAILAGKSPDMVATAGAHVILIGAFTNQANVKNLQTKLAQLGIKVYTEPLDTPQGKKIRVRAGPFATRDVGEKALEKMKRIGVNGVLTAKQ